MNLFLRILSAAVLLPLVIYLLFVGGFAFGVLIGFVFVITFFEFSCMVLGQERYKTAVLYSLLAGIAFILLLNSASITPLVILLAGFCVIVGAYIVIYPNTPKDVFEKVGII
ncbi:MAG: hypothetical protein O2897_03520, partial [bacterium]|nr:hypothetical protein [bacterium]